MTAVWATTSGISPLSLICPKSSNASWVNPSLDNPSNILTALLVRPSVLILWNTSCRFLGSSGSSIAGFLLNESYGGGKLGFSISLVLEIALVCEDSSESESESEREKLTLVLRLGGWEVVVVKKGFVGEWKRVLVRESGGGGNGEGGVWERKEEVEKRRL